MKIQLPDISSKVIQPLYENVGKLGKGQRIGICAGAFFLLIGAFVYFSFLPKFTEMDQLKKDIEDLERKLMLSRRKALQLNKYRKMMAEAETEFKIAKKALPEKKEIPSLLTGITDSCDGISLPGNRLAVWPSSPMPSITRSNNGAEARSSR